jgi:hypothetical protein
MESFSQTHNCGSFPDDFHASVFPALSHQKLCRIGADINDCRSFHPRHLAAFFFKRSIALPALSIHFYKDAFLCAYFPLFRPYYFLYFTGTKGGVFMQNNRNQNERNQNERNQNERNQNERNQQNNNRK